MRFSKDEFMNDIVHTHMWPNNMNVDWDRIWMLAQDIHEKIEDAVDSHQTLIEGIILMEWLSAVATVNQRALRQQMLGQIMDGQDPTEVLSTVMTPAKEATININLSDLLNSDDAFQEVMKNIQESLEKVGNIDYGPMEDVLKTLKDSNKEMGTPESFEKILNALKSAVEDSDNEEE